MFVIALCKRRKFSIIGFLIQLIESVDILADHKKFYWVPAHHVSIYDATRKKWINTDIPEIEALSEKEFDEIYETVDRFPFLDVPMEAEAWLYMQIGKKYSYYGIWVILRKILNKHISPKITGEKTQICTETALTFLMKAGAGICEKDIEVSSINDTHEILKELTLLAMTFHLNMTIHLIL